MKKTYEVVGRYPAFRPVKPGTTVELPEEAARYHVLHGTLKETPTLPAAPADAAKPKAGGK